MEKRPVPDREAAALTAATLERERAQAAWDQAVTAALATGASLREIAALAGVSHGTIENIAKRR